MSGASMHETGDVREAWGRITAWLERNDPEALATLGRPGSHAAIREAELRMGLDLPREMRQWLLANDIDAGRHPDDQSSLVALGCEIDIPGGHLLLGLTDIQRVYLSRMSLEEMEPSADPDHPFWRREWVPIAAERDGLYGTFLDTLSGTIGSWDEACGPEEGAYASLFAFFQETADRLEGVSTGDWRGPGRTARPRRLDPRPEDESIRLWARANGYLVNDRGRIPTSIREAYEVSQR
ncbi:histone-like nucleoid-structuring protein Lsr2 [Streptomyces sp. RKAG293]|uniref:Lsr2 family DNA-binding protein n=1 Tax=Streptomyces sp. RKAG293 TaxID=2893403 RepID=UPI0020336AF0|nr:histone-like nucleoid-structuring protein Lsr2 [Streptomyces sp. RKAG293]MCM2422775.1 Lsr2 family protein [Streptomyces sp. RKAG293]